MYWREYRTQFHIAQAYGISESAVCRTIQKVEDVLINSGQFRLPGKKALQPSDTVIEIVLVDVTEQPIEHPKKTTSTLQWQEKTTHPKSTSNGQSGSVKNLRINYVCICCVAPPRGERGLKQSENIKGQIII